MRGWKGPGWAMAAVVWAAACGGSVDGPSAWLEGTIVDASGQTVSWATVSAVDSVRGVTVSVPAGADGHFAMADPGPGNWTFRASAHGYAPASLSVQTSEGSPATVDATLGPPQREHLPGSGFLAALPDGEEKRRFILDCTGCHVFNDTVAYPIGSPRTADQWAIDIARMLGSTGPGTGFPIISSHPQPGPLGEWLAEHLTAHEPRAVAPSALTSSAVELTEYDVPEPLDLPHDLMVDANGQVIVTGMFTHRMYQLDPSSGAWRTEDIPVEFANPRALEIDAQGRWWVLLGAPQQIGMYEPSSGAWEFHAIGMYPHSIMRAPDGLIWFNGHFSYQPEVIASLDPNDGSIQHYEVPHEGDTESTIPYGLRVDPAGVVWATQLRGNRLIPAGPIYRRPGDLGHAGNPQRAPAARRGPGWGHLDPGILGQRRHPLRSGDRSLHPVSVPGSGRPALRGPRRQEPRHGLGRDCGRRSDGIHGPGHRRVHPLHPTHHRCPHSPPGRGRVHGRCLGGLRSIPGDSGEDPARAAP